MHPPASWLSGCPQHEGVTTFYKCCFQQPVEAGYWLLAGCLCTMNKRCFLGFPGDFDSGSCKKKSFFWVNIQRGMHRWRKRQCQAGAYTIHIDTCRFAVSTIAWIYCKALELINLRSCHCLNIWSPCMVVQGLILEILETTTTSTKSIADLALDSGKFGQVFHARGPWDSSSDMLQSMLASSVGRWCGLEVFVPPSTGRHFVAQGSLVSQPSGRSSN
jgi:hypothetical protein